MSTPDPLLEKVLSDATHRIANVLDRLNSYSARNELRLRLAQQLLQDAGSHNWGGSHPMPTPVKDVLGARTLVHQASSRAAATAIRSIDNSLRHPSNRLESLRELRRRVDEEITARESSTSSTPTEVATRAIEEWRASVAATSATSRIPDLSDIVTQALRKAGFE